MAAAKKHRSNASETTPMRRYRIAMQAQQNYFEPGRVGRKTGITLKDTGIRDEHGLEPVSGIFSSPGESVFDNSESADDDVPYDRLDITHGAAEVLVSRSRTPRIPLARASTPRRTNLGSPKRMSTARRQANLREDRDLALQPITNLPDSPDDAPPPNRKLNFQSQNVRASIEAGSSPFRPRKNLRRSVNPVRPDKYDLVASPEPGGIINQQVGGEGESTQRISPEISDQHAPAERSAGPHQDQDTVQDFAAGVSDGDDDYDMGITDNRSMQSEDVDIDAAVDGAGLPTRESTTPARRSVIAEPKSTRTTPQLLQTPTPSKKRDRSSMEAATQVVDHDVSISMDINEPVQSVEEGPIGSPTDDSLPAVANETIDPSLLASEEQEHDPSILEVAAKPKGRRKAKIKTPTARKSAKTAEVAPLSPSKRSMSRAGSLGPTSNMHLRSTTPFEDAEGRISRYGRTLTQPLKYWANETRVWKHGEIEGVVRAEEVEKPLPGPRNKKAKKRTNKTTANRLEDIEEVSDTESLLPDDWEEEIGVMAGTVANWNRDMQQSNAQDPVREDLAFAASAIITREAANADFRFAKIMTLPFFGSGIVEMPPGGYKREKPSGKMQMVFFVHEGKVSVEVGSQSMEINRFTISKGGVWVVPRGNKYAITNESRTKGARIFFAQGCEVDLSTTSPSQDAAG